MAGILKIVFGHNSLNSVPSFSDIFYVMKQFFIEFRQWGTYWRSIKRIFFVFLMQLGLWRAAPFMSSPIQLFDYPVYIARCRFSQLLTGEFLVD